MEPRRDFEYGRFLASTTPTSPRHSPSHHTTRTAPSGTATDKQTCLLDQDSGQYVCPQ
jgi:hypothetical protein